MILKAYQAIYFLKIKDPETIFEYQASYVLKDDEIIPSSICYYVGSFPNLMFICVVLHQRIYIGIPVVIFNECAICSLDPYIYMKRLHWSERILDNIWWILFASTGFMPSATDLTQDPVCHLATPLLELFHKGGCALLQLAPVAT